MRLYPSLSFLCLIGIVASTAPAMAAPPDPADVLFNDGVAAMEASHFEEGCPKLEESYRLNPRPGTLFALADCEAGRGRVATAVARYDEYLALYETLPPDKKAKQGTRQKESMEKKAALGPDVPQLMLVPPRNAPRGMVVTRDGIALSSTALASALPVDPGEHLITTQLPGGAVSEVRVVLAKGEKQRLELTVKGLPDVPPEQPPPGPLPAPTGQPQSQQNIAPPRETGPSGRRVGAYIAGSAGLAGLVIGGVTGGLMLSKKGVINDNCKAGSAGVEVCRNQTGVDAGNSAKTLGLVSTIGFVVGLAGLGSATVLFVTEPRPPKQASSRSNGGRWVRAGVLEAGTTGALLGGWGVW